MRGASRASARPSEAAAHAPPTRVRRDCAATLQRFRFQADVTPRPVAMAAVAALLCAAVLAALPSPPASGQGPAGPVPASLIDSCRLQTAAPGQTYRFC